MIRSGAAWMALWLGLSVGMGGCGADETPHAAEFVVERPAQQDFGSLRVHFNALPTLSLSEAVARRYAVPRQAGTALVVVALRQVAGEQETPLEGQVRGEVIDLIGQRQSITLRPVRTGEYVDYIGTLDVSHRDTYRFTLTLYVEGRSETLKFQRNF